MELYCAAHGVNVQEFDVITYREMLIMYANGMIGNRKTLELAATTLGAMLNYMTGGKPKMLGMRDILGDTWNFWDPPREKTPEEIKAQEAKTTQENLMAFLMSRGGMS